MRVWLNVIHNRFRELYGVKAGEAFAMDVEFKVTAQGRASLSKTTDDHLMTPWRLKVAGNTVMEQPRYVVLRDLFNHAAHHRGQLTVYLRLNGAKIPSVYGPSADDQRFA